MEDEYLDSIDSVKGRLYRNMKKRQQGGIIDCCEEYKFIKRAQTKSFNNKMNSIDGGITHLVLDEDYNQLDILIHDITEPVKYSAPIVIGIVGYPRAGKSEAAQLIFHVNKQANKKYKKRETKHFLCWTETDLFNALKEIKKGDTLWCDERPRTIGKGRLIQGWAINNTLHAIAKMENCFIFVTPKFNDIKVNICDLYLETAGQNRKTKINRFMILDDERRYFGHVFLKLHKEEEFRKDYEKKKDIFIEEIKKNPKVKASQDSEEAEQEELDEDLNDDLELLNEIYKSEKKERNLHIWKMYKKGLSFDEIYEIFKDELERRTILNIVYEISSIIKNL